MRAVQEAFIDYLAQGMNMSEACRRLGLSRAVPGQWAARDAEFAEAFATYRYRVVKGRRPDFVAELVDFLVINGFVDEEMAEDVREHVTLYCARAGVLASKRPVIRSKFSYAEQRRIVDGYIALKKSSRGDTRSLRRYQNEHGVTQAQLSTWAHRLYGKDALKVGPYRPGMTRERVLDCVRKSERPMHPNDVAEALELSVHTVRNRMQILANAGELRKVWSCGRVSYAS